MKKNHLLATIFFLIITASLIVACNNEAGIKAASTDATSDSIATQKARVERGNYLANTVTACIDCHSPRDITKFSLPTVPGTEGSGASFPFGEAEGIPGTVWAPNITPKALGNWTDEEIIRAVTQGVNKKGDTLFPIMPYHHYSKLSKEDIYSIVAYLRTLPPSDSVKPARQLHIPMSMLGPLPANSLDANVKPDPSDKVKYGEYMVTAAVCGECHTPRTPQGAPDFSKAFSGGFVFNTPFFKVGVANITPDSSTGIGTWTEDAFIQKFRTNASPAVVNNNPGRMNTMMPWTYYGKMTDEDLKAVYAYLRTVKPVNNKVEKWPK